MADNASNTGSSFGGIADSIMAQMARQGKPKTTKTTVTEPDEPFDMSQLMMMLALLMGQGKLGGAGAGADIATGTGGTTDAIASTLGSNFAATSPSLLGTLGGAASSGAASLTPAQIMELFKGGGSMIGGGL